MKAVINPKFPPTDKQISYLGKLTGIRGKMQLGRFVARRLGKISPEIGGPLLTKFDFSRAIDAELKERTLIN